MVGAQCFTNTFSSFSPVLSRYNITPDMTFHNANIIMLWNAGSMNMYSFGGDVRICLSQTKDNSMYFVYSLRI